jgi:hypothetical protein
MTPTIKTNVRCTDCGEWMTREQVGWYTHHMMGELQRSLTDAGAYEALCQLCFGVRQDEDNFGPDDFIAEFCG